jgi:hypothetical protein
LAGRIVFWRPSGVMIERSIRRWIWVCRKCLMGKIRSNRCFCGSKVVDGGGRSVGRSARSGEVRNLPSAHHPVNMKNRGVTFRSSRRNSGSPRPTYPFPDVS